MDNRALAEIEALEDILYQALMLIASWLKKRKEQRKLPPKGDTEGVSNLI